MPHEDFKTGCCIVVDEHLNVLAGRAKGRACKSSEDSKFKHGVYLFPLNLQTKGSTSPFNDGT
jgi:hypothetical protein